jgi:hypothetical protein
MNPGTRWVTAVSATRMLVWNAASPANRTTSTSEPSTSEPSTSEAGECDFARVRTRAKSHSSPQAVASTGTANVDCHIDRVVSHRPGCGQAGGQVLPGVNDATTPVRKHRGRQSRVGLDGLEPSTSSLSGMRSNRLSYRPLSGGAPARRGTPPRKVTASGREPSQSLSRRVTSIPPPRWVTRL